MIDKELETFFMSNIEGQIEKQIVKLILDGNSDDKIIDLMIDVLSKNNAEEV